MVDDAEEGGGGTRAPSMQRSYGSSLAPFTQIRSTGYELLGLNREHRQEYPNEKKSPLQPDLRHPPQKRINKYALSCALLASMNSTLLGYDVGVISGALLFIKEDLKINEVQEEVLVASLSFVSLGGGAIAGRLADAVGRRWTMALAASVFLIGALVMGIAPSFPVLMLGRILGGFGVGLALMVAPVYTAEVSPPSIRGSLVSLPEIFINFGILLGYISNYAFSGLPVHLAWRVMLGLGILPALSVVVGVVIMPESPRWLVMQHRIDEARAVIEKTSDNPEEVEERLRDIMEAAGLLDDKNMYSEGADTTGKHVWRELLCPSPPVKRMLLVASGIQFFQQATGIDATVYYSPEAFKIAGMASKSAIIGGTVAMGFTKCIFILVAVIYLDRLGRRPLLLMSAAGITVSLACIALAFSFIETKGQTEMVSGGSSMPPLAVFIVFCVCCYVASFSIGMGPICWVLTTEIFPLRLRAQAMSMGVVINRLSSTIVSLTFLSISRAISFTGTYVLFTAISLCSVCFFFFFVPETKGKSLEEITKFFLSEEKVSIELADKPQANDGDDDEDDEEDEEEEREDKHLNLSRSSDYQS